MAETKAEIAARMEELLSVVKMFKGDIPVYMERKLQKRMQSLGRAKNAAAEDMSSSIVRSHVAVCEAKNMGMDEAYGQDPAVYYSLAICGESGEMGNKIVKALRNGNDPRACKKAVISELPDVFIYGHVLAHVLGIDIVKLVNEKVDVVIKRAADGYYGGPLRRRATKKSPIKKRGHGTARKHRGSQA